MLCFHNIESTAAGVHSFRAVDDLHPKYSHRYGLVSSEVSHRIATMVSRHVVHTDNTDLHIPGTRSGIRNTKEPRRTATTHVPYAVLLTPGSALTSFDLATRPHRTNIKVRFHVVLPEG